MIAKLSVFLFLSGLGFLCFQLKEHHQEKQTPVQPENSIQAIENARFFLDVLDFDMAFPLEQNADVLFDNTACAVQTESGFFVANDDGSELFRYHLDGSFDRVVAPKGQGPGELGMIQFGTRIYDDQVGFWDLYRNQIIVFSEKGDYRFSLSFLNPSLTKGLWQPDGVAFDWPSPDRLVFGNIHVREQPEIRSGIVNVVRDDRGEVVFLELVHAFGARDLDHEAHFNPSGIYEFALVGDAYWLGSPEFSTVQRYSVSKGHLDIIPVKVPDPLTPQEYETLDHSDTKKRLWLINYHGFVHEIIPHPEMVFVKVGIRGYVPFSLDGRQLLNRRLISGLTGYQDVYNGTILFITSKRNLDFVEYKTGVPIIDKERNMAYDEDHPYVVLARLKLEPKAVQKVTK